jgi:hypothetical protein
MDICVCPYVLGVEVALVEDGLSRAVEEVELHRGATVGDGHLLGHEVHAHRLRTQGQRRGRGQWVRARACAAEGKHVGIFRVIAH